jgi:hypothetical protein
VGRNEVGRNETGRNETGRNETGRNEVRRNEVSETFECAICMETIDEKYRIITDCNHPFCDICMIENVKTSLNCPMCRKPFKLINIFNQITTGRMIEIENIHKNKHAKPKTSYSYYDLFILIPCMAALCIIEIIFIIIISYAIVSTVCNFYVNVILKDALLVL